MLLETRLNPLLFFTTYRKNSSLLSEGTKVVLKTGRIEFNMGLLADILKIMRIFFGSFPFM